MTGLFFELAVMLVVAELFTDALEHLGERLTISEGVTCSLFVAMRAGLPEALVPLVAIAGGTSDKTVNTRWAPARFSAHH